MTPDHVRGRLSSDAGATSSSISSPTEPSSMPTLSPAPSLTPSPVPTTSDNSNHRPFAGGLLNAEAKSILHFDSLVHYPGPLGVDTNKPAIGLPSHEIFISNPTPNPV